MGKLTALSVKNAKPGRHGDGKGLHLLVKDSGAKSWVLRIVVNGRRRDYGLGPADLVSLQEAREKALEGRRMVRAGLDPAVEWKRDKVVIPAFKQAAKWYHDAVKGSWKNEKHAAQWLSTLEEYAYPLIGARQVNHVDAPAIQSVLLPIWLEKPETARRVRQRVFVVLDYAQGKGWRDAETPRGAVNSLMKRIKQPRKGAGFAAMPYAKVPDLMTALRDGDGSVGRMALMFTILTAARSGEVRGMTWDEVDLNNARWDIPGERMKAGEAHSVPLSPAAVAILEEAKGLITGRKGEPVFPGLKGKPLSDATMAKALRVAGGGGYTVHGMRSSFRDWVAERTTYPGDWAEAALAHTLTNRVEAAYKRTKFFDQRVAMMAAWADYLAMGSNVVALPARSA